MSSVFKYHGSMSDNNGMISDEAVEAAARALVEALKGDNAGYVDASFRNDMTIDISGFDLPAAVRELLEAAAPYMLDRERMAVLIAEYGNELVGSSGGPEHLEYTYADAILGVAE